MFRCGFIIGAVESIRGTFTSEPHHIRFTPQPEPISLDKVFIDVTVGQTRTSTWKGEVFYLDYLLKCVIK